MTPGQRKRLEHRAIHAVEDDEREFVGAVLARISTLEQENARLRAELEGIRGHYRKSFKPCDCPTCEARSALFGAPKEGT